MEPKPISNIRNFNGKKQIKKGTRWRDCCLEKDCETTMRANKYCRKHNKNKRSPPRNSKGQYVKHIDYSIIHRNNLMKSLKHIEYRFSLKEKMFKNKKGVLTCTGFYKEKGNLKYYMQLLIKKHNLKKVTDLYQIKRKQYEHKIMVIYRTPYDLLSSVYPDIQWDPYLFKRMQARSIARCSARNLTLVGSRSASRSPQGLLNTREQHKQYMLRLMKQLNYSRFEHFYKINGGLKRLKRLLATKHYSSILNLFETIFPEYDWLPWKFCAKVRWVNDPKYVKKFMLWFAKKHKITKKEGWYEIQMKDLVKDGGTVLLDIGRNRNTCRPQKNGSRKGILYLLNIAYPKTEWLFWEFKPASNGIWQNFDSRKKFINHYEKKNHINSKEDWYKISTNQMANDAGGLMGFYKGSVYNLLLDIYPKYKWLGWKFRMVPNGFWDDKNNMIKCLKKIMKENGWSEIGDLYKLNRFHLSQECGLGIISYIKRKTRKGSIYDILKYIYPDHPWDRSKFINFTTEKKLFDILNAEFLNNIKYNIKKIELHWCPDWCSTPYIYGHNGEKKSKYQYEYDFKIVFNNGIIKIVELDGVQHIKEVPFFRTSLLHNQIRDCYKERMARKQGISVIRVSQPDVHHDQNNWKKKLKDKLFNAHVTPKGVLASETANQIK